MQGRKMKNETAQDENEEPQKNVILTHKKVFLYYV